MKKSFLAFFLAVTMLLSVCPVLVSAETADIQAFYDSITAESITQKELSDFVTKDLVLPTPPAGITISWESSDTTAITNDGKVTRADAVDKPVTLTATISDGSQTLTKEINLNVVANATNIFYQNNFYYPSLVGTSTNVLNDLGWGYVVSPTTNERSIKKDSDGNHYLYLDFAESGAPRSGVYFNASGSKYILQMDIKFDTAGYQAHILDLWFRFKTATGTIDKYPVRIISASVGGMVNLSSSARTQLYIEFDAENKTQRAKIGPNGTWSNPKEMTGLDAWTGGIEAMWFQEGSGASTTGIVEIDNFMIAEHRDRESYVDSLDVEKTLPYVAESYMTEEDVDAITQNLNLNHSALQAANAANGTTVTYESSHPDVIEIVNGVGVVKRPYVDTKVTLTATVSKNKASASKQLKFTVCASDAVSDTMRAVTFGNITTESNYAVTKSLNLSYPALTAAMQKEGTTVTFTSSNPDVLEIVGNVGAIKRGETEGTATLTATITTKDNNTTTKTFDIIVPARSTYVFKSEDFTYPGAVGENISEIAWACETDPTRFTTTIEQEDGDYYIKGYLPQQDTGTRRPSYTFQNDRDVKKISVEYTATYMEDDGSTPIYEFEFWGGTTEKDIDTSYTIARIQTSGSYMYVSGHKENTYYYGKTMYTINSRAAKGSSDRYRYDFDFENQGYDFYLNGTKVNTELMPFRQTLTYDRFKKFTFAAYRTSTGARIYIDDFVIQARDAEFTEDYISEGGQPLTLEVSFEDTNYSDSINMYVTSDYDEEYNLRQLFKVNNVGGELEKNVIFDYKDAFLVNKESGAVKSLRTGSADETAPPLFPQTYLGGNHGVSFGVNVTSANHGKTYGDIGSVWKDDAGVQWTLVRVNSANELLFLSETTKENGTWAFVKNITGTTLTYDTDADNNFALHNSAITIDAIAATSVQIHPAIGNRVKTMYVYRDGEVTTYENVENIRNGFSINCNKVVLDETYDIMDPSKIGYNLRANRPQGGYTSQADIGVGTPIMRYHQTITIYEDGDVTIEHDHEMLETFKSITYYGYQYYEKVDAFGGGVFRYMPGVKGITSGDRFYDFSKPFDMTNDELPGTYQATKDLWANENLAPDRTIEYYKDAEGNYKMAFAAGFVPIGIAAPDVRKDNITNALTIYNRTGFKVYPMLVNTTQFAQEGAKIQGAVFRHYDNLSQSTKKVTAYDVEYKDDVYYYVDFLEDEDNFTLDLSAKTVTGDYELVYKTDDVTYSIEGHKLVVSGKKSGYICVKGKRNAEIATVAYNGTTGEMGIWLNNRKATALTGDILIASYIGDKFTGAIVKKNISLAANDFTRLDITDFYTNGATDVKIFLLNMGSLTPISLLKEVTLN